jgi:hypothetical protein
VLLREHNGVAQVVRRVVAALLSAGALALAALALAAGGRVTITARASQAPSFPHYAIALLSGTVSSHKAGERVVVYAKECGTSDPYSTLKPIKTAAGGLWHASPRLEYPSLFRARWKRAFSRTATVPQPLYLRDEAVVGRTLVVQLFLGGQRFDGRIVQLQRKVSGPGGDRWVAAGQAHIRRVLSHYEARLRVPRGDVTVRAYFPRKTTRPCFLPTTSQPVQISSEPLVTIAASFGGPNGARQLVLSGKIASRAAGEQIALFLKGCGPAHRAWQPLQVNVLGETTTTTQGGTWRYVYPDPRLDDPIYVRARWSGSYSRPLLVRTPLRPTLVVRRGVARVLVRTSYTGQPMAGRRVELQRKSGSQWVALAHAALRRSGRSRFEAAFRIRAHGLRLRALLPGESARPCYLAAASESRRS